MFPPTLSNINFSYPFLLIFFTIGVILGIFLFWRAGKHELLESEFLFDVIAISLVGSVVGGRILEFIINYEKFIWSIKRLVFFNVYDGFNFQGALIGALVAIAIFLRKQRISFWHIFDLGVAPIVFSQSLIALSTILSIESRTRAIFYFSGYFLIFFLLKRLAQKKRHLGFFACFYLVSVSFLDFLFLGYGMMLSKTGQIFSYQMIVTFLILSFGSISWYILAKRDFKKDTKSFLAVLLLLIFALKGTLTNVSQANEVARLIVLLPYSLIKLLYLLAQKVRKELIDSLLDFMQVLGLRDRK